MRIFLAGPGLVGTAFLSQLAALATRGTVPGTPARGGAAQGGSGTALAPTRRLEVVGLASSRRMVIDGEGIDPADWRGRLESGGPADLAALAGAAVSAARAGRATGTAPVLVDTSASPLVADLYRGLLAAGVSVVTANKIAASRAMAEWRGLRASAAEGGSAFLHGANVGAGLPVIRSLADLVETGDRITRIEAVLSGTISFIFNGLGPGSPFSERVRLARSLGYTEPDPRTDLSALDAARKALILARVAGMDIEPEEVEVEGLLPPDCPAQAPMEVDALLGALASGDAPMEARRLDAERRGMALRHVATVEPSAGGRGRVRVGIVEVGRGHPLARLEGADNLVAISSVRYAERPLVIQGPGAGAEVTAAGVLRDLLAVAAIHGRQA